MCFEFKITPKAGKYAVYALGIYEADPKGRIIHYHKLPEGTPCLGEFQTEEEAIIFIQDFLREDDEEEEEHLYKTINVRTPLKSFSNL